VIGGAQDPGLPGAGAQAQVQPGGQGVLGGEMVERHGGRVGRAGQDVGDTGGQQDDIAWHQPGVWAAGDTQPRQAVGDGVEGRAGHGVQGQAPRFGGVQGRRDCSAHSGHRQHRGQGIHESTLVSLFIERNR
jgi:hypothetical protein